MAKKRLKKTVKRKLLGGFLILIALYMLFNQFDSTPIKVAQPSPIPEKFIPIYQEAEKEYGVPWQLLAAHHKVETKFSTMDPLISPVGAEGHMQFMPCTFVGWSHPTCEGLGKGNIPEKDKTNPEIIKKYGGYGVDANGDGVADPFNIEDAIFSAAAYLKENGAADGKIEQAVFAYNHSQEYVDDVLSYMNEYKNWDR